MICTFILQSYLKGDKNMNYEILINKYNKVHKEIIEKIKLVEYEKKDQTSSLLVEEKTLEMFLKLKNYIYGFKNVIYKSWRITTAI